MPPFDVVETSDDEERRELLTKILISLALFVVFWMVGASVFFKLEDWTFWQAVWFCYVFFATIVRRSCLARLILAGLWRLQPEDPSRKSFLCP